MKNSLIKLLLILPLGLYANTSTQSSTVTSDVKIKDDLKNGNLEVKASLNFESESKASIGSKPATSLVNQATSTSWVDQKVEEIKPQRKGLSASYLATIKSPFIVVKEKPKESPGAKSEKSSTASNKDLLPTRKDMSKEPLTLQMVLNSSALVNGKWLKANDEFRGYKLTEIKTDFVVLERKNKKVKLFIAQKNNNINISTK